MKLFYSCAIIMYASSFSPVKKTDHVKWLTITEAQEFAKKEKRPMLIDLYTDWCGWCKVMDKKTYANKNVADYLQNKFYAVRVNAETRENIVWQNKSYHFNAAYRANDFAVYITKGRLEFPTTIIIPADGSEPQPIPGYLETKDFELIVKYFGENVYNKIPFEEYQKNFKPSW